MGLNGANEHDGLIVVSQLLSRFGWRELIGPFVRLFLFRFVILINNSKYFVFLYFQLNAAEPDQPEPVTTKRVYCAWSLEDASDNEYS